MNGISLGRFLYNRYMAHMGVPDLATDEVWAMQKQVAWEASAQDVIIEHLHRKNSGEIPPSQGPTKTIINPNWMDITRDIATS